MEEVFFVCGGWYTTSDTKDTGYELVLEENGVMSKSRFTKYPKNKVPFVGVWVPAPDSVTIGLE